MTQQNPSSSSSGYQWPARSRDKVWLGVCGGFAEQWNINAWIVRVVFFLFVVPLGIVYYLGAQNMPAPSTH